MQNRYINLAYRMFTHTAASHKELFSSGGPIEFVTGMGLMVDGFEEKIIDMEPGTNFDFVLPPEKAFGLRDESLVRNVPRKFFEFRGKFIEDEVFPGADVQLMDNEGNHFIGTIVNVTDTEVTVDLNSPFAGRALQFTGIVFENREATLKEIEKTAQLLSGDCDGGCGGCGQNGGCGGCSQSSGCGGCSQANGCEELEK